MYNFTNNVPEKNFITRTVSLWNHIFYFTVLKFKNQILYAWWSPTECFIHQRKLHHGCSSWPLRSDSSYTVIIISYCLCYPKWASKVEEINIVSGCNLPPVPWPHMIKTQHSSCRFIFLQSADRLKVTFFYWCLEQRALGMRWCSDWRSGQHLCRVLVSYLYWLCSIYSPEHVEDISPS